MADSAEVAKLVNVLGSKADASQAAALLLAADGDLEVAVSMYFSNQEQAALAALTGTGSLAAPQLPASDTADEAGPSKLTGETLSNSVERANPQEEADSLDRPGPSQERVGARDGMRTLREKVAMLRELVGSGVGDASLSKQLKKAKGCVNAAANKYFARVEAGKKRIQIKESKASADQSNVLMGGAETSGDAEVRASSLGTKRPSPPLEDLEELFMERKRRRRNPYSIPKPDPISSHPQTTSVTSQKGFRYRSESGQVFMLPLKECRTRDGLLCAPLPESGFPDKVTPWHALNFSCPGLHLGSFSLSADSLQGLVIGGEDSFLDLTWDSASFQVGVTFEAPNGAFSFEKLFVTRLGRSREERDRAGISEGLEEALFKLHEQDFVRLFVTLDCHAELVSDWKARQKAEQDSSRTTRVDDSDGSSEGEDLTKEPADLTPVRLSVPLQESSIQKVFNLHVCLTEKAFKFDAEIGSNTGLASRARAFGNNRTGKGLADVTEALLKHGSGLKRGPDSDELLNQNLEGADPPGDRETLPPDLPGILDSISLPDGALEAECPRGLCTEPKRYQLQGLAWMLAREGAEQREPERESEDPDVCQERGDGGAVGNGGRVGNGVGNGSVTGADESAGCHERGMGCAVASGAAQIATAEHRANVERAVDGACRDTSSAAEMGNVERERGRYGGITSGADQIATAEQSAVVKRVLDGACRETSSAAGMRNVEREKAAQGSGASTAREKAPGWAAKNELFLHPCWQQLLTADGQVMYMQRERGTCSPDFYVAPDQGTCGGLLCDEMGLGKTLEVLMLALAHPPPEGWAGAEGHSEISGGSPTPIKATLVVVPASLLEQWKEETKRHVAPGELQLLHYPGIKGARRRLKETGAAGATSWDFEEYDVIVTSYEVVKREMDSLQPTPLRQFGFWRLVLDEAQVVANSASLGARTVANIVRRHAWVVTGTPITSRLKELEALLDFLGEPFGDPMVFHTMLVSPFEAREERGMRRLQALLRSIMLRRTKKGVANELGLPPCAIEDRLLTFSPPEASFYQRMHDDFATALRRLDRVKTGRKARDERLLDGFDATNLGAKVSGNALAALNRLRQACCHPQIVKSGGMSLGRARLSMPQIMGRLAARAAADCVIAVKDWLAARVALATERVHTRAESATDAFEPLLADIVAHATAAADISTSGSEQSPEWERKGQRTVVKASLCRLELNALQAFKEALMTSATGGADKSRVVSVQARITELEHELGVTADNLARMANKRELRPGASNEPDAETRRKRHTKTPEQRLMEAEVDVQRAKEAMEAAQGQENHLRYKLRSIINGKGKAVDDADVTPLTDDDVAAAGAADVIQEDKTVCPICLDSCQDCGAVTTCGHVFCGDCIRDLIDRGGASGAHCPLCRHPLHRKDVFDVAEQEEVPDFTGEYGTKISAVLAELSALRDADPRAKSVVFSSWRPLLALLEEALKEGNFRFATLWGSEEDRGRALSEFSDDPDVRTLLVTMGFTRGAAGLNLTAASTVFILEPSFHPGLEAQAASRIHRLGQSQPTRVVRFLVDATIEPKIAALAASRLAKGKHDGNQSRVMKLVGADLLQLVETRSPAGLES